MPDPREVRISDPGLQRPCVCCRAKFRPHSRLGARQKTCGKPACRKAHRAAYRRHYRKENPQAEEDIQKKRKDARPANFWQNYRRDHLTATARNRANSRLRKRLAKVGLQRQLDIVQLIDPPSKLVALVEFATSHRSLLEDCALKTAA